ncbi:MAG: hypothetical protein ACTSO7_16375 [Candidatus Heimdallarchaeota archaeon]
MSVLLMQVIFVQTSLNSTAYSSFSGSTAKAVIQPITEVFTPDALAGTELVQTNVFVDGDCEIADSDGEPSGFSGGGSGHSVANFSYQDEVHTGTYGGYMSTLGSPQYNNYFYRYRYLLNIPERSYLDEDIQLDFWYNAKANPDFARGSEMYFQIRFSTNFGNYYIVYYLSRVSGLPSNSSSTAYYDIRGSLNTWTNVVRNVTEDFDQVFGGGPDLSLSYVNYFYLRQMSVFNPSGKNVLLVDDMILTNTTGFDYFSDNGDFEDGDSWPWYNTATGEGTVFLTEDDYTRGTSAMNITIDNPYYGQSNTYAYAEGDLYYGWSTMPKGYCVEKPGDLTINFDWKYNDTPGGVGAQFSYFYVYGYNSTFTSTFYFMLGDQNDLILFSNSTGVNYGNYYMKADDFGSRDSWNEFTLDYYTLLADIGLTNQIPYRVGFHLEIQSVDYSRAQLLVDDFQVVTYPAGDPGFEGNFQYSTNDPILLWVTPNYHNYVNITSDAHSGNYAANLTAYTGLANTYCYRKTNLPVTPNVYTDFSWRLDKMTAVSGLAYSTIRLELNETKTIVYVLGSNDYYTPTNTSNTCYYFVENYNQTGTWNNLIRDLYVDIIQAFGSTNYYVTEIELITYASGTEVASTIFDDINFITDVEGPIITNLDQTPDPVEYGEAVTINADVEDNTGLNSIELFYRHAPNPFTAIPMTFNGVTYEAVIPAADYGTDVYYYIYATDIYAHESTSGAPVHYIVEDATDPILDVEAPFVIDYLSGDGILFNITAEDTGSGLNTFEISVDSVVVFDELISSYTFILNTTDYENGEHEIMFYLEDNAGNSYAIIHYYTFNNTPTTVPTNAGVIFGGLVSFGLVAIASSTMIYFSERRKKYLKL